MGRLQRIGMTQRDVDPCDTAIVDLLEELPQICASLVIHPCVGNQTYLVSMLDHADAELNVLAEPHSCKPICLVEHFA